MIDAGRRAGAAHAVDGDRVTLEGAADRALKTGRNRLLFTGALFVLAYLVVAARLVDLTVVRDGLEPRLADRTAPAAGARLDRNDIIDRNGVLLATNLPTASVYANPRLVLDADEAVAKLAAVLPGVGRAALEAKLKSDRHFVWIKRNLTPRQQAAVNRLGLPGVAFQRGDLRVYPLGRMFAHVLGFVDIDNRGIAGVEEAFDDALRADRGGAETLRLSLDARFQHVLREELTHGMTTFRAVGAAGLIVDADNGEVLALASLPDFDPNDPRDRTGAARFNRATLGAYEMGSTFKLLTVAMALDAGVVTMTDGYDASEPLRVARFVIRDYKPKNRWLSVPEIIVYSSNIGAAKMAQDVGTEAQRDFLSRLGLLRAADIELPEVATPLAPSPWREINTMTIGFGHGLAVSPLQLATAVGAVVNGGVFHPATLRLRAPGADAWLACDVVPHLGADAQADAARGRRGHRQEGCGSGLSGSAARPALPRRRASADISAMRCCRRSVAAFPMAAPRYVVVVLFDEPKGTAETFNYATGGWTAAPAVGRIIARIGPMAGIARAETDDADEARGLLIEIADRIHADGKDEGVAF